MFLNILINISPKSPRTLVPIVVDVAGTTEVPSASVRGEDGSHFRVDFKRLDNDRFQSMFWVEHPGDYSLTFKGNGLDEVRHIQVKEQVFLPFEIEFGLFFILLIIAAGGVFRWYRNRKKVTSSSDSSSSLSLPE